MDTTSSDPYHGNLLAESLEPIVDREKVLEQLISLPPRPKDCSELPRHIRLHHLMTLRDLFIPTLESGRVAETIDLMIRQGYRYRDPRLPGTWSLLHDESGSGGRPRAPATAAVVVGHSGVGKSETILRALSRYPQVIEHSSFPRIQGRHKQVSWISIDVPASGRGSELASNLMHAWNEAMSRDNPRSKPRFGQKQMSSSRLWHKALDEWRQVALSHFLGVLHLDEVQNFFRLPSLKSRRAKTASGDRELSIVEDQALRWILSLTNTWQIPLLISGTPDGVGALTRRLSNTQRFVTSGYHHMRFFEGPECPMFSFFWSEVVKHQWLRQPLENTPELRELVIEFTAGIPRLIIALWIGAQRIAMERPDDALELKDIRAAESHFLAPVRPAVMAIRSRDPVQMAKYEDLARIDDGFWAHFWAAN